MNFLIVFLSGGLGSVLRYAAGLAVPSALFPWATLLVNIVGCLAIGILSGLTTRFVMGEGVRYVGRFAPCVIEVPSSMVKLTLKHFRKC